jgi:hypothetical protein
MRRALWFVILIAGCESKIDKLDKAVDKLSDRVENNRVSKGLDKLDRDDAAQHLAAAREAIGKGGEAAEDCSWVTRAGEGNDASRDTIKELGKLCNFDVPLGRASRAVIAAEKAKAEQPDAPSLTECSSDEWAASKRTLDGAFGGESRWTDLKGRWTKVCPDAK